MRRKPMFLGVFSALALSAGLAAAEEIKLGVLAPLTGPSASDGQEFVRGVTWAVEEANAKGGVGDYTFKVEVADVGDQSAANVTSAVERLLGAKGVEAIFTGYASLSMFEVDQIADANVPYLSAGPSPLFAGIVGKNPDHCNCCWSYTADFTGYVTEVLPTIEAIAKSAPSASRPRRSRSFPPTTPIQRAFRKG